MFKFFFFFFQAPRKGELSLISSHRTSCAVDEMNFLMVKTERQITDEQAGTLLVSHGLGLLYLHNNYLFITAGEKRHAVYATAHSKVRKGYEALEIK